MTLVFHHGALGDLVLTFPLLASLDGDVTLISHASKARLAATLFPNVRPDNIDAPRWACLFASDANVALPPANRVISFVSDGDDVWAANVRRLLPHAECYFVRPRPPADWTEHVTVWHWQELTRQGLVIEEKTLNRKRTGSPGVVVVHPGSGGRDKCWPTDRFTDLVQRLRFSGAVRVIAGEAEAERWSTAALADIDILPTLDALHDALLGASLYIGNDSGPTHLAAWLGVPTIALFGPSDPRVWSPIGPCLVVVAPPTPRPMSWLNIEQVLAAAASLGYDERI